MAAVAMLVTACGSGSAPRQASSNSPLALSQCMRSHGVPNFPDPTKGPGGEGMTISATPGSSTLTVDGIAFSGPAFQSAVRVCKLFGGSGAPGAVPESTRLAELAFARCMRSHGVPNFPDPIFPAGGGIERPGAPGINRHAPAVARAAAVCNR
jgi:hypothetical protein